MRRVIFFLFILVTVFNVNGQSPAGFPSPYSTNWYRVGYLMEDSAGIYAVRDTTIRPRFAGFRIMWQHAGSDTSVWVYNGGRYIKQLNTQDTLPGRFLVTTSFLASQGYLKNINGYIQPGTNVNFTGSGTLVSPYVINATITGGTDSAVNPGLFLTQNIVGTTKTLFADTSSSGFSGYYLRRKDSSLYVTQNTLSVGLAGKFNIPSGPTTQYVRGDGSLAVFPTNLSSFLNGPGYITGNQSITFTASGDINGTFTHPTVLTPTLTINANAVTYSKFQQLPAFSFVANSTNATANTQAAYFKYGLLWNNDSLKVDTSTLKSVFGGGSGINQLTGDGTAGPGTGSQVFTLATVNSNVGIFGSASSVAQITLNGKGLATAASTVSIQIIESQVTNLVADLAAKQATISSSPTQIIFNNGGTLGGSPELLFTHSGFQNNLYVGTSATNDTATLILGGSGTAEGVVTNSGGPLLVNGNSAVTIEVANSPKMQFSSSSITINAFTGSNAIVVTNSSGVLSKVNVTNSTLWGTDASGNITPITLGTNLSFTGTTLNASGGGSGITQLTGDGTAGPGSGSQVFTLATVNSNVGTFGSASSVSQFTVNGKGLITASSSVSIQIIESQVTNLVTDLAAKQATLTGPGYVKMVSGSPTYLTPTQVTADLNLFGTTTQGLVPAPGSISGKVLSDNGTWISAGGTGTVISFSFTNGNGFTGTVTSATTTPALSLAPSFTGLVFSNGSALAAATISSPLTYSAGTLAIQVANTSQNGYLTSADWNTFNNKTGPQTFQQTLTTGNLLNKIDTINQAGFDFHWFGGGKQYTDSFIVTTSSPFTPPTAQISAGNSITVGAGATVNTNGYAYLYAGQQGLPITNIALSGSGAWYSAGALYTNVNPGHSYLTTAMFGLNDLRRDSTDTRVNTKILNGFGVAFYNQYLKVFYPGSTSLSAVKRYGTWSTYGSSTVGGKGGVNGGAYTNNANDSLVYTFTDSTVLAGLMGTDSTTSFFYTEKMYMYMDNVLIDSVNENNQTDGVSDGVNNNKIMPFVWAKRGLTYGSHVLKLVNKTAHSYSMVIDWVGNMTDKSYAYPLLVFDIPHMGAAGYPISPSFATQAHIDTMNAHIHVFLNSIKGGYPVYIALTNSVYTATDGVDVFTDHIHPNDLGHRRIDTAGLNALPKTQFPGTQNEVANAGRLVQYFGNTSSPHVLADLDEVLLKSTAGVAFLNQPLQTGSLYASAFFASGISTIGGTLTAGPNGTTTSSNPSFRFFTGGVNMISGYKFGGTNYLFSTDTTFTTGYPLTLEATSYTFGKYTGSISNFLVLDPSGTFTATLTGSLSVSTNSTFGGQMTLAAATTSAASLLITSSSGTNPTSPSSGQLWWNGTNLNFRTGSTTVDLLAGGGAVSSVANSDGTLTISPTTGAVVASLALGHANTWTALQTFGTLTTTGVTKFTGLGSGSLTDSLMTWDATSGTVHVIAQLADTLNATNGLQLTTVSASNHSIGLNGTLTQNTIESQAGFTMNFRGGQFSIGQLSSTTNWNPGAAIPGSFVAIFPSTLNDNVTSASGTIANAYVVGITSPILTATNTGVTITNAFTFYVNAQPTASTNETITNSYSLGVGGPAIFQGQLFTGSIAFDSWQTITSGTSATINNTQTNFLLNPSSLVASFTITLPSAPDDGQLVKIHFGGTITSGTTVVTTLTISPNSGQTIEQTAAPVTALGGDCFMYQFNKSNSVWYREK